MRASLPRASATLAAASLLIGPLVLAAPAASAASAEAATGCYRLDIVSLTAHNTEESTDEIGLLYNGVNHRVNMSRGNVTHPPDRNLPGCNQAIQLNLWEWDSGRWFDPHDFLGSVRIGPGMFGSHTFSGHGTNYELQYHVLPL